MNVIYDKTPYAKSKNQYYGLDKLADRISKEMSEYFKSDITVSNSGVVSIDAYCNSNRLIEIYYDNHHSNRESIYKLSYDLSSKEIERCVNKPNTNMVEIYQSTNINDIYDKLVDILEENELDNVNMIDINKTLKSYKKKYEAMGMTLLTDELDFIDSNHLDCIWYGGTYAQVKYGSMSMDIMVVGDVRIYGVLNGEQFYVKDRQNAGRFYSEAGYYLNDNDLNKVFTNNCCTEEDFKNADTLLQIDNNNWIEALIYDADDNCYDLMEVFDESNTLKALDNPAYIKELFEYIENGYGISHNDNKKDKSKDDDYER